MPKTYTLPAEAGIWRGDDFELVFRSKDGETAFEGDDWQCQLRRSRFDSDAYILTPDLTGAAGDPPIIRFTLDGDETADIEHSLLSGDVVAGGITQAHIIVPVSGQYTVEST